MRRTLTYNLNLLLILLRKRLAEFETSSSDGKLVLTRAQRVDLVALFLPDATDEARAIERIDTTIRQAADLGFLRELRSQPGLWEVRRILKAYVDAQILSDFAGKLAEYARDVAMTDALFSALEGQGATSGRSPRLGSTPTSSNVTASLPPSSGCRRRRTRFCSSIYACTSTKL